ncbi:Calcium-dependent secretion activator 1 [Fasciola gigantica]|uniref:Calcium-dependent secretion activator 1 n=1 Tax=Fasciola gigantica TaxID=46835 RepID=A0A504YCF2_FASGI|nr:Calcium-dependent secretion activator 1 [Fasciola gigantica]
MLNTSSSEDDEYDLSSGGTRNTNQDASGWRNYEYSGFRGLDLRSKPPDAPSSRKSSGAAEIASIYARFPAGPRARTTPSPVGCGGWQPLHVDSSSKPDSPRAIIGPQRPPRLSALSHPPHHLSSLRDQSAGHGGLDVRANTMASTTSAATGTGGQFSVSFEGISESGPIGTRLSPVGSSCWSSEQHISPDLNSLMSSSTNSVSAGLSLSSGRHTVGQGVYPSQTHPHPNTHHHHHQRPLQRQPSAGTGCSGGAYSIDHLKSTTHSVRSAPLCLGSPIEARCFRQLTLDVQTASKGSGPTPPSLVVSDPEEELHQKRLQLYVFASRCVACPVLCPVSQGPTRRYLKVTRDYLMTLKERFQMFLKGEMTITCDEAFHNAISDFFEIVLESDRIASMVKSGSCSMYDIREVFITNIEKRFQTHQLIEGLSKESVVSAWKIKFDQICRGGERPCPVSMTLAVPQAEVTNPSKDQLYELLMRTLAIQKYEHQVLYNACQLDNADEQAAQLRRELTERLATIESMSKERSFPKLVHKEMESQFIDEEKLRVNELVRRLDSIPVLKGFNTTTTGPVQRRFRKNPMRTVRPQRGEEPKGVMSEPDSGMWSKQCGLDSTRCTSLLPSCSYGNLSPGQSMTRVDAYALPNAMVTASGYHGHGITREAVRLDFTIEILVCQLRNLRHLSPSKKLYCTIELEGNVDRKRTEPVVASKPVWDTTAEFQTTQPLPALKLKIFKESSGPLAIDDKELGKITLYPTWCSPRNPQWLRLQATKHCHDVLELQASISMQRPTNLKYANYCWIQGRTTFKKWKRRYICLTQVSQYTFVLAAYGEQKAHPSEFMALDGFTVDYCEARPELISSACSMRNMKPDHHQSTSSLSSLSRLRFGSLSRASNIHPRSGSTMNVSGTNRSTGIEPEPNASFFFKLVREGDTVIVATANDSDRQNWVQAIYRATGQTHKPSLSSQAISAAGSTGTGGSTANKPAKEWV